MKTLEQIALEVRKEMILNFPSDVYDEKWHIEYTRRLIERLGKQEPVAWQYRIYYTEPDDSGWGMWHECNQAQAQELQGRTGYEVRELYAATTMREGMVEVPVEPTRSSEVLKWAVSTFGDLALNPRERAMRFIEEALELVDAVGLEQVRVESIANRVYGRPQGNWIKEFGQAMLTLEALAEVFSVDVNEQAAAEFSRIKSVPQDEWERRHKAKADIGIATPMLAAAKEQT